MAIVLKPPQRRLSPVGPVKIDWSHPITRGMLDCLVWNSGGGSPPSNLAFPSAVTTLTNSPTSQMTAVGPSGYATGGSAYNIPNHVNYAAGDFAIRLLFLPVSYPDGTYNCLFAKTASNELGIFLNSSGNVSLSSIGCLGGPTPALGVTAGTIWDFVWTRIGPTVNSYVNGALIASNASYNSTTASAGDLTFGSNPPGGSAADVKYITAQTWNRSLGADEVASLYADPYAFLVPAEGEMPALQGAAAAVPFVPNSNNYVVNAARSKPTQATPFTIPAAIVVTAAPPFIPNSNDNFNVRQLATRAAAAILCATQATTFAVPPSATPTPQQFGWYQHLSKPAPIAQAKLGSTFVPFNTAQVVPAVAKGWYNQLSPMPKAAVAISTLPTQFSAPYQNTIPGIAWHRWQDPINGGVRNAKAQPTQLTSFAVPASVAPPAQTPGQFGWWANLSKSAPVAQARPGNTFVPFNTAQVVISPQTVPLNYDAGSVQQRVVYYQSRFQVLRPVAVTPNTITGMAWHQPLGVVPPIARAQAGSTSVPFNTRQINSITGMGWFQPLSRSAPVATAQAGFSFVPFNTKQVVTIQVAFDPFVKKRSKPKRDRLRDELEIKYKRRLAIEEAFWPPTTYELPPYQLPEHVKPAPDVSDLANVIMQVQQMRAAQAKQQDEEDENALLELLKREYGIEDV